MPSDTVDSAPISADLELLSSVGNDAVDNDLDNDLDTDVEEIDGEPESVDTLLNENEDDEEDVEDPDKEEEPEEEEKTPDSLHSRPTVTDIKKKFPDFFKKFPELKHVLFREAEYSSVFPTVDSAKESAINNDNFTALRQDVFHGDGSSFVEALKNEKGLENFSVNFLDNLASADKEIHWKAISPVLQQAVRAAFLTGRKTGNANLENSSKWLADYLFGNGGAGQIDPEINDILSGRKSVVAEKAKKATELTSAEKELNTFKLERIGEFSSSINQDVEGKLISQVTADLSKYALSTIERKTLTKEIIDKVATEIAKDGPHMKMIDNMWKQAGKNGFKTSDKSSIITASLARAKSLIPSIRRTAVAEALKDSTSEISKRRSKIDSNNSRREIGSQGRPSKVVTSVMPSNPRKINWGKTSDMDILSGRATLKN